MRALLDLMRKNKTAVQSEVASCAVVLVLASKQRTILDLEVGEVDLIQAVAAALARLSALL